MAVIELLDRDEQAKISSSVGGREPAGAAVGDSKAAVQQSS
jgi:hypothetical protein